MAHEIVHCSTVAEFGRLLDEELQRVSLFVRGRSKQLRTSLSFCRRELLYALQRRPKESVENAILERVKRLADDAGRETVRLDRFQRQVRLQLIAAATEFDRVRGTGLVAAFVVDVRRSVLSSNNLDVVLVELSSVYVGLKQVREHGGSKGTWKPPTSFERSTVKYWVRPEDVLAVKVYIAQHLPVLVFGLEQGIDPAGNEIEEATRRRKVVEDSSPITSVYVDSLPDLRMYHRRVDAVEGNKLIRVRWYGDPKAMPEEVFMEQKTHHESWVAAKSVKERFNLPSRKLKDYTIAGVVPQKQFDAPPKASDKKRAQLLDERDLAHEIAGEFVVHGLVPVVRTIYRRTAFQLASTNAVRISIDTDMSLVRERGFHDPQLAWARDLATEPLLPGDIQRFPYAVLEVKLQEGRPDWVRELVEGPLVVSAEKFSKFQHGVAVLWTDHVRRVPWWFGEPRLDGDPWFPAGMGPGMQVPELDGALADALPADVAAAERMLGDEANIGVLSNAELAVMCFPTHPLRRALRRALVAAAPALRRVAPSLPPPRHRFRRPRRRRQPARDQAGQAPHEGRAQVVPRERAHFHALGQHCPHLCLRRPLGCLSRQLVRASLRSPRPLTRQLRADGPIALALPPSPSCAPLPNL